MTVRKIRSVVKTLILQLESADIRKRRMPKHAMFDSDFTIAKAQMKAHAHWLLAESMTELLSDKRRLRSRSGHGKIGRHLASAQVLLWTANMFTRGDLMEQNRKDKDRTTKRKK